MAHEINMERLGESSSKKKHPNALKPKKNYQKQDQMKMKVLRTVKMKKQCYQEDCSGF